MYLSTRALAGVILLLASTTFVLAEAPKVEKGKPAPEFTLPVTTQINKVLPDKTDATTVSLKDFQSGKGKNVVLFFYPKAMTKGCTIESCGFRDLVDDFAKLDTVVIGISTDKLDAQTKFTEMEKLNFPLLADSDKKVTEAFGALGKNGNANRYTFVIDKKGVVREVYTKVSPTDHPKEVLNFVKENLK